jgi:hypothetical protein
MKWLRIMVVAPIWGPVAAQLVLQMLMAFVNLLLAVAGFVTGRVKRRVNAMAVSTHVCSFVLFGGSAYLLNWLVTHYMKFSYSALEGVVFWILFCLAVVVSIPEAVRKFHVSKRQSFVPGAIEEDIWRRKLRAFAKTERTRESDE